jgi:hypothetical protein
MSGLDHYFYSVFDRMCMTVSLLVRSSRLLLMRLLVIDKLSSPICLRLRWLNWVDMGVAACCGSRVLQIGNPAVRDYSGCTAGLRVIFRLFSRVVTCRTRDP